MLGRLAPATQLTASPIVGRRHKSNNPPQTPDKENEHQPQIGAGGFVGGKSAGPRPEKHGDRQDNGRLDVDVTVAVLFQRGTEANGRHC